MESQDFLEGQGKMAQNAQVKPGNACPHRELPVLVSCVFRKMSLGATEFPGPQTSKMEADALRIGNTCVQISIHGLLPYKEWLRLRN